MDTTAPIIENVFGIPWLSFDLANVLMIALACAVVFIFCMLATRNLKMKPTGLQNFIEWIVDFVKGMVSDTMDWKRGKIFLPLALTLILFIFVSNLLGLVTVVIIGDVNWWKSPTADPAVTLTLAGMVIVLAHYYGARLKGFKTYGKSFFQPVGFMLPFNIIGELTSTLTLGLRLFGNIYGGGILSGLITTMALSGGAAVFIFSTIPAVAWLAFKLFVSAIQAFIFMVLSLVYISNQIE